MIVPPEGRQAKKKTLVRAAGDDNREVVGLAKRGVEDDIVVHLLDTVVTDVTDETNLVVDDEQRDVVPIDPLERVCSH